MIQFIVGFFFFKKSFKREDIGVYLWGTYIRMGTYIQEFCSNGVRGYLYSTGTGI